MKHTKFSSCMTWEFHLTNSLQMVVLRDKSKNTEVGIVLLSGYLFCIVLRLYLKGKSFSRGMLADIKKLNSSGTSLQDYTQEWNPEEMAGNMILLGNNKIRQLVQVKVYRTSAEHFAVLYPMKKVCRPLGVMNLKNTMVERLGTSKQSGFTVRQCGFDTPLCSLTFFSESNKELDRWINAFSSRNLSSGRGSSLPILEEDDEI